MKYPPLAPEHHHHPHGHQSMGKTEKPVRSQVSAQLLGRLEQRSPSGALSPCPAEVKEGVPLALNGRKAVIDKTRVVAKALLAKFRGDKRGRGRRGGSAIVVIVTVVLASHGRAGPAMGALGSYVGVVSGCGAVKRGEETECES